MNARIKIKFSDFWKPFNEEDNFFTNLLRKYYDVEISNDPDLLIFSCYGFEHRKYKCKKIFYTGEYEQPDFLIADYAFTFDFMEDPRQYRLPLYVLYSGDVTQLVREKNIERIVKEKKKFCNFLYSNSRSGKRQIFLRNCQNIKKSIPEEKC